MSFVHTAIDIWDGSFTEGVILREAHGGHVLI
jgi:hypothetical protein